MTDPILIELIEILTYLLEEDYFGPAKLQSYAESKGYYECMKQFDIPVSQSNKSDLKEYKEVYDYLNESKFRR